MLADMNENLVRELEIRTDEMNAEADAIRARVLAKRRNDDVNIVRLNGVRATLFDCLKAFIHDDNQKIVVPMSEVMVYVRTKDPVILLRNFQSKQRKSAAHDFWKAIHPDVDSGDEEDA
jgi:hypothetical protein